MTTYKGNHGTYGLFGKTISLNRLHIEQIRCKRCKSIDCHGCNLLRLEQMLKEGKLDEMMGEDHGIKTDLSVRPVVLCRDCQSYNKPRLGFCEVHLVRMHGNDFCSYGKKREES